MKRYLYLLLIVPMFVACNQKELKKLRTDNAELTVKTAQQDSTINVFLESLNTIEENLAIIREKEKVIDVNAKEKPNKNLRERIADDITLINDLFEQNKQSLAELEKKLKNSSYQNSKLRKLADRLKLQLATKEKEIVALNEKVEGLNIKVEKMGNQIAGLEGTVSDQNTKIVELNTLSDNQQAEISDKTARLHAAYYIAGSAKELVEKQVISKSGGFLGIGRTKKLSEDFLAEAFTQIDLTETKSIPVSGKKVKLVTSHPVGSYEIQGEETVEAINILNPEEFWKASKYLVVEVR
ncbi:hypothetical protein EYV94_03600 [Puteibacter caeruleilacunae]|nr:hypothetical protein EYV94_03600 [Puteibacter caeruleilacunae]